MSEVFHFIAELSGNHMGDVNVAKEMIRRTKEAGAWACKLQCYKAENLYAKDQPLYSKVKEAELNIEEIAELKLYAEKTVGVNFVCTVFVDPKLVDGLESIGLKYFKIRCADSANKELIERVLKTGKPAFISAQRLPVEARYLYHPQLTYLYCNPFYPPRLSEFELNRVAVFEGFSCHFPNIIVPLAAAIMAKAMNKKEYYIETHVTLDHSIDNVDKAVSIDFKELAELIRHIRMIEEFAEGF